MMSPPGLPAPAGGGRRSREAIDDVAMRFRPSGWSDVPHLIAFALIHATVAGTRPTVSYRALDLGAGAGMIGLIGGSFAALSLVAAIPIGSRMPF